MECFLFYFIYILLLFFIYIIFYILFIIFIYFICKTQVESISITSQSLQEQLCNSFLIIIINLTILNKLLILSLSF